MLEKKVKFKRLSAYELLNKSEKLYKVMKGKLDAVSQVHQNGAELMGLMQATNIESQLGLMK